MLAPVVTLAFTMSWSTRKTTIRPVTAQIIPLFITIKVNQAIREMAAKL